MDSPVISDLVIVNVSTVTYTDNVLHGIVSPVDVPMLGHMSRECTTVYVIHTPDATPDVVDQLSDFENNNDLVNVVDEQPDALPVPRIYCSFISKTELDPGGSQL